jgi:hypothetical protein
MCDDISRDLKNHALPPSRRQFGAVSVGAVSPCCCAGAGASTSRSDVNVKTPGGEADYTKCILPRRAPA